VNYEKLKEELANSEYDELSDSDAADLLNANDETLFASRKVSYLEILNECAGAGEILDIIEASTLPDVRWAMVGIKSEGIDIGHPKTRAMIGQLVYEGIFTVTQGMALTAMAPTQSKAQSLGLGLVSKGHVNNARIS
tara:strand:+ start:100 stop:510 length:411 start_codon:yes stop_codon:yes gene_type:complete